MKRKHRVIVQNKRIRYDFEIRRNITVIRGDSATGKTALVDMTALNLVEITRKKVRKPLAEQ